MAVTSSCMRKETIAIWRVTLALNRSCSLIRFAAIAATLTGVDAPMVSLRTRPVLTSTSSPPCHNNGRTCKAMATVFLNEEGALSSLDEDLLNDIFEQSDLLRLFFDHIYKAIDILHCIRQIGYALIYRNLSQDDLPDSHATVRCLTRRIGQNVIDLVCGRKEIPS